MPSLGAWKPDGTQRIRRSARSARPRLAPPRRRRRGGRRDVLAAVHRHLGRCKLAANTVKAYRRQTTAYVAWLAENADHADAFSDVVGAEAAVTAGAGTC